MKKGKNAKAKGADDAKSTRSKVSKKQPSRRGSKVSVKEDSVTTSKLGQNEPLKEEQKAEEIPQEEVQQQPPAEEAQQQPPADEVPESEKKLDEEQQVLNEVQQEYQQEEEPAQENQNQENQEQEEDPMSIQEHVTVETKGAHLAENMADDIRSQAATEKIAQGEEEMLYDPNTQMENLTEVGNHQQQDSEQNNQDLFDEVDAMQKEGMISIDQINIVQQTWNQLIQRGVDRVGIVLFKNVFRIAPEIIDFFPFKDEEDVYASEAFKTHATTVASIISKVVGGLHNMDDILTIQELGFKHATMGILPEHYPVIGKAILNTLRAGLKKDFTRSAEQAWENTYKMISETMVGDLYTNADIMIDELTDHKIELVQSSWRKALGLGPFTVGNIIFTNFFEADPGLLSLFSFTAIENWQESVNYRTHVEIVMGAVNSAIENLTSLDSLLVILKKIGKDHIERGIKKEDYDTLGGAILKSLGLAFGDEFTFELRRAWVVGWTALKNGLISSNYEDKDRIEAIVRNVNLTDEEIDSTIKIWRRVTNGANEAQFGIEFWDGLLTIVPEINGFLNFELDNPVKLAQQKALLGGKIFSMIKKCIAALTQVRQEPDILHGVLGGLTEFHNQLGIDRRHHWLFREAFLEKLEMSLEREMTNEEKEGWVKTYRLMRNMIHGFDLDEVHDPETKEVSTLYVRIVQQSWKKLKRYPIEISGPLVYKNLFEKHPQMLEMFPFKDQKNFLQSAIVKKQTAAVVGIIGRGIEVLDNFESIVTILNALGEEHRTRRIDRNHFNCVEDGLYGAIKEVDGPHWDGTSEKAWRLYYQFISRKMLEMEEYDHMADLSHPQTIPQGAANMAQTTRRGDTTRRGLMDKNEVDMSDEPKIDNSKIAAADPQTLLVYQERFKKEVDFHHKLCYRMEKAYRLGRKMPEKRHTLNLEIIDLISDHSSYIEQDHMSLFYCLFFCIYFKNQELLNFIRSLIQRIPPNEKVDKLLEIIDVHGIEKLRLNGDSMNQFVYHMVLYQAIDDDLRVVYASILRHLRFVQLRDCDAVHLLETRDYEIIRSTFDKYSTKLNIESFGYKLKGKCVFKCQSYRRYNQAYYEEIVINYNIEQRVAQNYRERFLVTPEDIYIVFEMYCKEDYDDQFCKVKKDDINHKQFVDLFIYCLKNDSFKIAILIYTLYLDQVVDMDEKMLDIIMLTIKESVYFHEIKLFFIHEHFNVMSVQQLNNLVDIYQQILHNPNIKLHPIVSQFNTIKVALLIYRICWKIEVKQIYSLITKCSLLQDYMVNSLCVYFEKQNNILTLYKMMLEPVLHMTEKKDCLDIMYEMSMQVLLKHPVVVEVLNLVNEGKYSITATPLSMSQTYVCLNEMKIANLKSMNERLIQNIVNFGDSASQRQTALQFNIWKQSIDQRQFDEMLFTSIYCIFMLLTLIIQNNLLNNLFEVELGTFGQSLQTNRMLIDTMPADAVTLYCSQELTYLPGLFQIFGTIQTFGLIYCIGMISSCVQKLCIFRFKDNVSFDVGTFVIEVVGFTVSGMIFWNFMYISENSFVADKCSSLISMTPEQNLQMAQLRGLIDPVEGFNFKYLISVIVIQITGLLIMMLKRTQFLGELIQMLSEMIGELMRFFTTFGLVIFLFLLIGRFLSEELQSNIASYWAVFLDLFDAFNGKPHFENFTQPAGQMYIATFLFIFKILLVSLLAAMFINKYKIVWQNLDASKRFQIIRLKNSSSYDKYLGAMSLTFFPVNILMLPFLPVILLLRSSRASDFLLKLQFVLMMIFYSILAICFLAPLCPLLYVMTVLNSIFIAATNKRQEYKGENMVQLTKAVLAGPIIITLSLIVDFLTLPGLIMKESDNFEHKYSQNEHSLTDIQIDVVMLTFYKIFYGLNFIKFKDKHMTLIELMQMHRGIFSLNENLHDLFCKGNKDYKEALSKVQDYNMTKILTRQCSIPDLDGNFKDSKVELNVVHAIQFDVELYNHIDITLRRLKMGQLYSHMKNIENGVVQDKLAEVADANDEEQDDELTKKVGVLAIGIGPDGNPLKRNSSDVMNNFWVNFVVRAFTNCEEILNMINQTEKRRDKRFQLEVKEQQLVWEEAMISSFKDAQVKYDSMMKTQFVLHNGKSIAEQEDQDQRVADAAAAKVEKETESTGSSGQGGTINETHEKLAKQKTEKAQRLAKQL